MHIKRQKLAAGLHKRSAYAAYHAGDMKSCFEHARAMLELDPYSWVAHWRIATTAFRHAGQTDNLATLLEQAMANGYSDINLSGEQYSTLLAAEARAKEQACAARGIPPLLIFQLPKSASDAFASALITGLDISARRISLQHHLFDRAVPNWVKDVSERACVSSPHLPATPHNLSALSEANLNRFTVIVRDPRQALLSRAYHIAQHDACHKDIERYSWYSEIPSEYVHWSLNRQVDFCLNAEYGAFVDWIEGWVDAANHFEILFLTFEELNQDIVGSIIRMLEFQKVDTELLNAGAAETAAESGPHLRRRLNEEWRDVYSNQQITLANDRLSSSVCDRFGWHH